MTRDEIISMAREAELSPVMDHWTGREFFDRCVRFATLVAAKERERFALECIDLVAFHGGSVEIEAAIRARGQQ